MDPTTWDERAGLSISLPLRQGLEVLSSEVVESAGAEVERYYLDLLAPVPGIDSRDVPSLNLSAVKSEAQRVLERGVPAPLPRPLYATDEADPTIRSAA